MSDNEVINLISDDEQEQPEKPAKRPRLITKTENHRTITAPDIDGESEPNGRNPSIGPTPTLEQSTPAGRVATDRTIATDTPTPSASQAPGGEGAAQSAVNVPQPETANDADVEDDDEVEIVSSTTKKRKPREMALRSPAALQGDADSHRRNGVIPKQEPATPTTSAAPRPPLLPSPTTPKNTPAASRPSTSTSRRKRASEARGRSSSDDEIQVTAQNKEVDMNRDCPHARFNCSTYPFSRKQRQELKEAFCKNCHCFVCDLQAQRCAQWKEHCRATQTQRYLEMRQLKREEREKRKNNPEESGTMFSTYTVPRMVDDYEEEEGDESPDDGMSSDSMDGMEWYPPIDHDAVEQTSRALGSVMIDSNTFAMADLAKHLDEPVYRSSSLRAKDTTFDLSKALLGPDDETSLR